MAVTTVTKPTTLQEWPRTGLRGRIARFLPYFDGQIWKLNRHTFGYKSIRELRSGVHAAAVSRGVKLRTAAMDDDVHLVIQQIGQIPTRAQREAAE
jgi:hypothetical protein